MFKKALVILTVTALAITGCKGDNGQGQQEMPAPMVIVEKAATDEVRTSDTFVGKVDAVAKASITARVSGFLEKILVNEGDFVKKDQVLFTIEKDQYVASVRQAEGALTQAEANAKNNSLIRERSTILLESASISRAKYDEVVAADDVAKANVASARAALQTAQLNLEYTEVRSPIDGRVGLISYNIGETVGPTSGIITTVIAPDPMYVLFNISDKQLQDLRRHYSSDDPEEDAFQSLIDKVILNITFSGGTQYPYTGKINFIDNAVTGATDSIRIRGEFRNPSNLLTQGQTVSVTVSSEAKEKRIVVPQAAIVYDIGGKYVIVIDQNNTAVRRVVETGDVQDDGRQVIMSGLEEGESYVVEGAQKVQINKPVTPMSREQYNNMIKQQQQQAAAGASEGK